MLRRLLVASLLLALGACASNPISGLDAFARHSANNSFETFDRSVDPPSTLVLPVAHDRQTSGASCGAHALASVIAYWRGAGAASGQAIFTASPPANPRAGYSMTELISLAQQNELIASAVRLPREHIVRELEAGRPVIVPVRVPSVFIQPYNLPGANLPILGLPSAFITGRVASISELTGQGLVNHYVIIVGYQDDTFVVVEPVMGFRTISFDRLERYRRAFNNAAIVLSADRPPAAAS